MTAAEHLRESLDDLGTATGWVDEAIRDVESTTLDEATACLAQLREHVARLRQFDAALERWIADIFRDQHWRDPQETAAGLVEVKRSTTRRMWDHDQAGKAWLSATLDASGGEVTGSRPDRECQAVSQPAGQLVHGSVGRLARPLASGAHSAATGPIGGSGLPLSDA